MRKLACLYALAAFATPVFAQEPVTVHPDQQALIQSDDPQIAEHWDFGTRSTD